ncbi:MAG: HesA/MoeB/ThiF family protein [Desulfohalobiaceae bacterium]|nr:HesA/MoeB/ThiF family protein [Desulfohalobiaceae bacterium]
MTKQTDPREDRFREIPGLVSRILKASGNERHPSGKEFRVLSSEQAARLSQEFDCSLRQVWISAMEQGVGLRCNLRNLESVSLQEQLVLFKARVAIVGAGGLGGQVILSLARLGLGRIVVVDPDVFDETNLNRQALCTQQALGRPKAEVAVQEVAKVNPALEVTGIKERFTRTNGPDILTGAQVVLDCLDNIPDRFVLEQTARDLGIPLVHAAIDGFLAQLMTIYPKDQGLSLLYGREKETPKSPLGNPVFAPNLVAVLQAMEVLKIVLGRGEPIRNSMLSLELESGRLERFSF